MRYPKFIILIVFFTILLLVIYNLHLKYELVDREVDSKDIKIDKHGTSRKNCQGRACHQERNEMICLNTEGTPSAYIVDKIEDTELGIKMTISQKSNNIESKYGPGISPLVVDIAAQSNERLHVKIYDPNNKRWEIPTSFSPVPDENPSYPSIPLYKYINSPVGADFHFSVVRNIFGDIIFDTCGGGGLQFTDQFLSIGTHLPDKYNIYGLGEHVVPSLRLPFNRTYTMWNYDTMTPKYHNIYSSHPFYLEHRPSAGSHGVFLRNSNGMDVILNERSLIYNTIGGVLDFYFFLGPSPEFVIQQYQEVIGRPQMPPYWGLGFHQCRYGYPNIEAVEEVVKQFKNHEIPLDTMWTDIDYMDEYKVFTVNSQTFPKEKMAKFVDELHSNGQQYIVIIDPGIKVETGYTAYDDGIKMDIFIKNHENKIFTGKVWPGNTAFPDFFHPKANEYWEIQISRFHDMLPIDGLWIDMNEISSFHDGEMSLKQTSPHTKSNIINPPYAIDNQGSKTPLNKKTLDPDAIHYGGVLEYDAHNLYGLSETIATSEALEKIRGKRSFVITRSTFPGSGGYGGHWTGDNHASWEDLAQSVIDVLNFQLYSIPLVGADICGFSGDTDEELCARWMELGAFYTFSRSHSRRKSRPQEPYLWDSVARISRKVLGIRYSLLPYYYTLFYKTHKIPDPENPSATVLRPLFFEFLQDQNTFNIDTQFMIGPGLLVSPVLQKGAKSVKAYFPEGKWYDFHTFQTVSENGEETIELNTPLDHIQIHIYGGSIIPLQSPSLTTKATRQNPFSLLVALDGDGNAMGDLFWDDGESINIESYIFVNLKYSENTLNASTSGPGYSGDLPALATITILGMTVKPEEITLNGIAIEKGFTYDANTVTLTDLDLSFAKSFIVQWI